MPIETIPQPQKKSNLRKPGSPKITGKHVQFDEKNLHANRDAAAAERLKSWEKKHPNIQREYAAADLNGRKQLLALYATIQLYGRSEETAQNGFWDRLNGQLFSKDMQALFTRMAERTNSWDTCKDLLHDEGHLDVIEKKGVGWEAYAGKRLDEAAQLPAEKAAQTPEALLAVFDKKYPKPEEAYYQKDINGRMEMLQEYLLPLLLKSETEQDAGTLRENIQKVPGEIILKSIARSARGWETCKELLNDQELQFHAANPDAKQKRGDEYMECADRLIREIKNHPKEKAFLDALPKPSDPALVRQNINAARAMAEELFNDIEQVDFNLLGSGSKEFDAMKKSVKEFKQFACEKYHVNRNGEITPEMQKKLLEKTQNSLESIKTYLYYKQEQFDKDPARRDAAGRQKHEQPRILKSIGMFEKLSRFYLQQSMTKPGWEYKPTEETEQKKSAFEQKLQSAKTDYTTKLASRQSKERMGAQELFNEQDKREAAKEQPKQKKAEAPKGMKK